MHHAFKHDCDSWSPNLWQPAFLCLPQTIFSLSSPCLAFLPLPAVGQRNVEKFCVRDHRMLDFYTAVYTSTNYQAVCKLRPINLNTQSETLEYQLCIYTAWSYFRAQKIRVFLAN